MVGHPFTPTRDSEITCFTCGRDESDPLHRQDERNTDLVAGYVAPIRTMMTTGNYSNDWWNGYQFAKVQAVGLLLAIMYPPTKFHLPTCALIQQQRRCLQPGELRALCDCRQKHRITESEYVESLEQTTGEQIQAIAKLQEALQFSQDHIAALKKKNAQLCETDGCCCEDNANKA